MSVTVFTSGSVTYATDPDGTQVMRIDFEDGEPSPRWERHELPSGARLNTNGAIGENFGRGGTVLEVIGLAELRLRGGDDPEILSEATGSCRLTRNEMGLQVCDQGSCSGSCVLKGLPLSYCVCR